MVLDESQQVIWNIDNAEMYAIFEIKTKFIEDMLRWDLDSAYWDVRTLRMELDSKLKRKEKKIIEESEEYKKKNKDKANEKDEVDKLLKQLSEIKEEYNKKGNPSGEDKCKYYFALENFYMHLCYLMKKYGMYFREGEDRRIAVLRR